MTDTPERGSFPKGPRGETGEQRRDRYEAWIIATPQPIDRERSALMAQPNHNPAATRPSQMLAIRARCWQCVAGDDDANGTDRIAQCKSQRCELWSVRPNQPKGEAHVALVRKEDVRTGDFSARALARPGSRPVAIKGYCFTCQGGRRQASVMRAVDECQAGNCALWMVRPRHVEHDAGGPESEAEIDADSVDQDAEGVETA